ncbi:MAG TPA: cardiolipin synthase ClsB [Bordetella sp.]
MKDEDLAFLTWTNGNAMHLLQSGADFFPALCAAIDGAQHSVHLETYIFALDRTGYRVLDSLMAAARRGVQVCLVLDGFGSSTTIAAVRAGLDAAGGQCLVFRPEPRWWGKLIPSRNRLRRLHRKTAVIDGAIAFVGGINIEDDYDDLDPAEGARTPRFDFSVEIRGPLVADVIYAQDLMWVRLNWSRLRRNPGELRDWPRMRLLVPHHVDIAEVSDGDTGQPRPSQYKHLRAALVLRDNVRFRQTFERAYLCCIRDAEREILIANAYFFPGRALRKALLEAAERGVRVRILLQGKSTHHIQYHATRVLYDHFLAGGIEIHEYQAGYIHAKAAVIDDIATVGSSNLDPFSLLLAREANVMIDDEGFAADLKARVEQGITQGSVSIQQQEFRHRGWLRRGIDNVSYALLRIGVALTGQSRSF